MKRLAWMLGTILCGMSVVGCGGGQDPSSSSAAKSAATSDSPGAAAIGTAHNQQQDSPDVVVGRFLEALRRGDDGAEQLMTTKAREETAKHNLVVQPPGTSAATYQVGQVSFVTENKDGVHVDSVWTEPTGDGGSDSFDITWILRLEKEGWRIAGMATHLADNEPPLFLNFEDPADMLQKWQQADGELAGSQSAVANQAGRPAGTATTR